MSEIQKLKQLVDIPRMIMVVRDLNNRLVNCKDGWKSYKLLLILPNY